MARPFETVYLQILTVIGLSLIVNKNHENLNSFIYNAPLYYLS